MYPLEYTRKYLYIPVIANIRNTYSPAFIPAVSFFSLNNTISEVENIQNPMVDELNEEKDHSVPDGKSLNNTTNNPAKTPVKKTATKDL